MEVGGISREGCDVYTKFMALRQIAPNAAAKVQIAVDAPGSNPEPLPVRPIEANSATVSPFESHACPLQRPLHQDRRPRVIHRLIGLEVADRDDADAGRTGEVGGGPAEEFPRSTALLGGHQVPVTYVVRYQ